MPPCSRPVCIAALRERCLSKVTLVSKVLWFSIYRCRHHVNLVNVAARITAFVEQRSDMSNDPGDCGVLKSLK